MRTTIAAFAVLLSLAPALAQTPTPAPAPAQAPAPAPTKAAVPAPAAAKASAAKIDFLEVQGSGFADPADVVAPGKIMRYFSRTPAAAAHPGTAFGMTVKTVGQPDGADVVLRWVWKLPKPGIKDAKTGKPTRQEIEEVPTKIGAVVQHNYEFRTKDDIVPGKWRAEVYNGERRLAVRRFAIK